MPYNSVAECFDDDDDYSWYPVLYTVSILTGVHVYITGYHLGVHIQFMWYPVLCTVSILTGVHVYITGNHLGVHIQFMWYPVLYILCQYLQVCMYIVQGTILLVQHLTRAQAI